MIADGLERAMEVAVLTKIFADVRKSLVDEIKSNMEKGYKHVVYGRNMIITDIPEDDIL